MEYFRSTCLFYSLSRFPIVDCYCSFLFGYCSLILGFTAIAFILFYFAYIYTMIFVLRPSTVDARGTNYVKSLFQLFTGLFLAQLWITAIFVFSKNWACVALEGVIVVVTIAARLWMKWKFLPLVDAVPISAIKYAAGDPTYSYPIHDQGLKEIKVEGKTIGKVVINWDWVLIQKIKYYLIEFLKWPIIWLRSTTTTISSWI